MGDVIIIVLIIHKIEIQKRFLLKKKYKNAQFPYIFSLNTYTRGGGGGEGVFKPITKRSNAKQKQAQITVLSILIV